MGAEYVALIMAIVLLLGLFMGHPLAFVLGGSAVIGAYAAGKPMVLGVVINRIFGEVLDNYTLIAIPLFILMAQILSTSDVTDRMFEALRLLLARVRGGLALAVVFVSVLLAATTGIIGASITVTGVMAMRPMLRYGYDTKLSAGVIAASGCLGILIPPSIMLVLMASYSPLSVGELFAGAMIPGLLLGLLYAAYVMFIAWLRPDLAPSAKREEQLTNTQLVRMLIVEALPTLLLILGILGTMLLGVATATEASAVGVLLSLLIVISKKQFKWSVLLQSLYDTARTSAMILFLVIGATAFTGVFNMTGGLSVVQDLMRSLDMPLWMLLTVMLFIVFILGCFLDWTGVVLLSFPIFLPMLQEMGVDLLWFVVLMAVVLQTSFLTPPFGYALFYLRAIAPREVHTMDIIKGVIPFIVLIIGMSILVALVPSLATWLPNKLYNYL